MITPTNTPITATPYRPPIDIELSREEVAILRRLRQIRRASLTSTTPAALTIHIDDQGAVTWYVGTREQV